MSLRNRSSVLEDQKLSSYNGTHLADSAICQMRYALCTSRSFRNPQETCNGGDGEVVRMKSRQRGLDDVRVAEWVAFFFPSRARFQNFCFLGNIKAGSNKVCFLQHETAYENALNDWWFALQAKNRIWAICRRIMMQPWHPGSASAFRLAYPRTLSAACACGFARNASINSIIYWTYVNRSSMHASPQAASLPFLSLAP